MNNKIRVEEEYVRALINQGAWKPSEVMTEEVAEVVVEEEEETQEALEEHVCPLCESTLEEELSEDVLIEHIKVIQESLKILEEEEETEEDSEELEESDGPSDDDLNKIGDEGGDEDVKGKKGPSKTDLKAAFKKYKSKTKKE